MTWKQKIEAQIAFFRLGTHHHVCKEDATTFADNLQALLDVAVAARKFVDHWPDSDYKAADIERDIGDIDEALDKLREVSDE